MSIFVVCCLLLFSLVISRSDYLGYLPALPVWEAGIGIALLFWLAGYAKKLSASVWHDGFVCGLLWAWYAGWQPIYGDEVPMFYGFPLYFALLTEWSLLAIVNRSARFDEASQASLRYMHRHMLRFDTRMIAAFVLASLMVPEHYLLYPIAMTSFIVRYAVERSLEIIDGGR